MVVELKQTPDAGPVDLQNAWLDRDLSWLEFNRRVLQEALDDRNPLLERVKFLAIFSSNLDEFFMKRMALVRPSADESGIVAQERRDRLLPKRELIVSMLAQQAACYTGRCSRNSPRTAFASSTGSTSRSRSVPRHRESSRRRSRRSSRR